MSMVCNTAPPIYDADMFEPFIKRFNEKREEAEKEFAKYGNNMDKYMEAKIEELNKLLSENSID